MVIKLAATMKSCGVHLSAITTGRRMCNITCVSLHVVVNHPGAWHIICHLTHPQIQLHPQPHPPPSPARCRGSAVGGCQGIRQLRRQAPVLSVFCRGAETGHGDMVGGLGKLWEKLGETMKLMEFFVFFLCYLDDLDGI